MRTIAPTVKGIKHLFRGWPFLFILCPILFAGAAFPLQASAYPAIVEIVLNGENKGSFFVEVTESGAFLVSAEDFDTLGLPKPTGTPVSVDGAHYFALSDQQDLIFALDEQALALNVTVRPEVLPLHHIDFTQQRPGKLYHPLDNSLFFNYGLSVAGNKNDPLQLLDLTHELAYRNGKNLFLTDGIYSRTEADSGYIRLMSRVIRDDRQTLQRFVAGDHYVLSGPLGSQVQIGGAGYSRNFNIDPYFINYPSVQLGGAAATPSTVEIYIDGLLVREEEIPPGPFRLENITRYEGAGDVEIVIRDAFNQEQRIQHPFYLAENLLIPGADEYSYSAGLLRENFGLNSNDYGDAVFSGFYRYGYKDWLTIGLASEISPDFFSLAPRASMKWQHYGYFDVSFAASSGSGDDTGFATSFEYFYRNRRFSTGVKMRYFSESYSRLDDYVRADKPQLESQLRFGYAAPSFGSLNLGVSTTRFHTGEDRDEIALTYNRRLSRNLSMYATLNRLSTIDVETIFLLGFNFSLWRHHQVSARFEDRARSRSASISIQKDPPIGAGYGYRAAVDMTETDNSDSFALNAAGQHNSQYAIVRGEADLASIDSEFMPGYQASVAGAMTHIGGLTRLTRPVRDSFTLVKVGELENIRVVRNSEVIGRTDRHGIVMVPELTSYYDNQIAIMDEDIPIEYGLETALQYIQPPLRSGACVIFNATRIQPLIGKFSYVAGGKTIPYEYRPLKIYIDDRVIETQTGYDGEFYIDITEGDGGQEILLGCDNLDKTSPGDTGKKLRVEYDFDGESGVFRLDIPPSDQLFIEMGELVLND